MVEALFENGSGGDRNFRFWYHQPKLADIQKFKLTTIKQ
jgi:hypothetical protein